MHNKMVAPGLFVKVESLTSLKIDSSADAFV